MSGTITETYTAAISNGTYEENISRNLTTTQTTEGGGNPGYVNIGTSEEDISFGDVTPRIVIIENMDATNFVKYGPKSGGSLINFIEIPAGDFNIISLKVGETLRYRSDTGTVNFLMMAANP